MMGEETGSAPLVSIRAPSGQVWDEKSSCSNEPIAVYVLGNLSYMRIMGCG